MKTKTKSLLIYLLICAIFGYMLGDSETLDAAFKNPIHRILASVPFMILMPALLVYFSKLERRCRR